MVKDVIPAIAAAVAVLSIVGLPVACVMHDTQKTAEVVSKASDPVAARCAMGGTHTLQTAACTLKAAENLKK